MEFNDEGRPLFPERAVNIIDSMLSIAAVRVMAHGDDDQRRQATRMLIEQMRFEGIPVGGKARDQRAPVSKDTIAFQNDGRIWFWDWQNGTTRDRQVKAGDPGIDITNDKPAFFEWPGINHLGVQATGSNVPTFPKQETDQPTNPPAKPTNQPASGGDMATILTELRGHKIKFDSLAQILELLASQHAAEMDELQNKIEDLHRMLEAQGTVLGNTSQNVAEALTIARGIDKETSGTKGQVEAAGENIQKAVNTISTVAAGVEPLVRLLAALRK